jgi:hypothetical protein
MENHKKNYLFRLGPMLFFPKGAEPKSPAYKDSFEQYRNLIRLAIIGIWGMITAVLISICLRGEPFGEFTGRPIGHYVVMSIPLAMSLADLYLVWLEKRTSNSMNKLSKNLIYGAWFVSAVYYSTFLYSYFILQ